MNAGVHLVRIGDDSYILFALVLACFSAVSPCSTSRIARGSKPQNRLTNHLAIRDDSRYQQGDQAPLDEKFFLNNGNEANTLEVRSYGKSHIYHARRKG